MDVLRNIGVNLLLSLPLVGAYALFALGIVVIYRASRVLNLAHGAMAVLPAYLAYAVAPVVGKAPALVLGIASGGALGLAVERLVVRRLGRVSATAQTVGTVAVLMVIVAFTARTWNTLLLPGVSVLPTRRFRVGLALLSLNDLALFVAAGAAAAAFFALFKFTSLGMAMRLAADNPRAASLVGINPRRTTAAAWVIGGLFAALGGVMLGAASGLHPYILPLQVLPGFVAALIGGLESPLGALAGSVVVGAAIGFVPSIPGMGTKVGAPQLALAIVAFVIMALRGKRFQTAADTRTGLL